MKRFSFKWPESSSLVNELSKPIQQASFLFEHPAWNGPTSITLLRSDETALRINSEMCNVEEKIEVGVLIFSRVAWPPTHEQIVDVDSAFNSSNHVSKLVIEESGASIESGLIFNAGGKEIIIVAGAFPLTLAVNGILTPSHVFEPEYSMDRYTRVPL
jgi:hypothetical protein